MLNLMNLLIAKNDNTTKQTHNIYSNNTCYNRMSIIGFWIQRMCVTAEMSPGVFQILIEFN